MKLKFFAFLIFVGLIVAGFVCVKYYGYVFAHDVKGVVAGVERVNQDMAIIAGGGAPVPKSQLYSFAIGIKAENGEIYTASSEDRQWAVVQKGQCAEAKFYPYPPWEFDKSGTFHGARLIKLYECPPSAAKDVKAVQGETAAAPEAQPSQVVPSSQPQSAAPAPVPAPEKPAPHAAAPAAKRSR